MIVTDYINGVADGLNGFTQAGAALGTAVIGWIMFWGRAAKLIPTEFKNRYIRWAFKGVYYFCKFLALDWPDIAGFDMKNKRIVTKAELTATKIVNAATKDSALEKKPDPPAAPPSMTDEKEDKK